MAIYVCLKVSFYYGDTVKNGKVAQIKEVSANYPT